jgi:hypothetical protein
VRGRPQLFDVGSRDAQGWCSRATGSKREEGEGAEGGAEQYVGHEETRLRAGAAAG